MVAIKNTGNAQKTQLDVCIGKEGLPVGELAYVRDGAREYSVFAYGQDWLRHPAHFSVSPDLALVPGYLSAASLLQAGRNEEHAYTEVVDAMKRVCAGTKTDAQQLWRRLVFNHLITNVDDHLQNMGFLYVGNGLWRLAPAFDLNPFPDKDRESKTWLSEDTGPITSLGTLLEKADAFHLTKPESLSFLAQVHGAISRWRSLAMSPEVGLTAPEVEDFAPAFEHSEMDKANSLLST